MCGEDDLAFLFSPFVKTRSNTSVAFQCGLKQQSAIHQHFSQELKDWHLVLHLQDHQSSSFINPACMRDVCWLFCGHDVVDMSFCVAYETTSCFCVCVSAKMHSRAWASAVAICVCVSLMCRLFSDSQFQCWATWLRTGGTLVYLPAPNTHK